MKYSVAKVALIAIAGFGCIAGARLSLEHLRHGEVCPMLGPIPACILVFVGYLCIAIAASIPKTPFANKLFFAGWIPVFLLALIGVVLEIAKGDTCPDGTFGIPQCFYSLGVVLVCLALFKFMNNRKAA